MEKIKLLLVGSSGKGALENSYKKAADVLGLDNIIFDPAAEEKKYLKGGKLGRTLHLFLPVETWIRKMNRELILVTRRFKPDVIVIFTNAQILTGTLACIRTIFPRVKIVWIWPDTPMNLERHNLLNAPLIDLTATYSKATLPVFERLGCRKLQWVPLAGDPYMHGSIPPADGAFSCDISFVGTWRPERERVMAALCERFKDKRIEIHGRYWKRDCKNPVIRQRITGEGLYEKDMARLFTGSYININIIDDTNYPAANMRFFEIPTAGGLQLTSTCPEMEDIFRHQRETIYFTDEQDAVAQATWAFDHPEECAAIRERAHHLLETQHTYQKRMEFILEQL